MRCVDVTAGTVEYEDTGGDGPVLVFAHGLLMDGREWRDVVADLRRDHRCVLPTLPLGAHRRPMRPDADLSLRGLGRLLTEVVERLDLHDVTLCFNDWGGAQVMIDDGLTDRVGGVVLTSCEAFDNYPPGIPGRLAALSARTPGALVMMRRAMLVRALRNLPITFGAMSKRGIPDDLMREWLEPLRDRGVRRDFRKYAGDAKRGRRDFVAAIDALASFERPVLVAWASEDRLMPVEHGRRLAATFPHATLVEIPDSYTLVPIDQPSALASAIREFVAKRMVEPSR